MSPAELYARRELALQIFQRTLHRPKTPARQGLLLALSRLIALLDFDLRRALR